VENVKIEDQSPGIVQFAVTGPAAESILSKHLPIRVSGMDRGAAKMGSLMVARYIAARIGPTSAWTLEVMIPTMFAARAWEFITIKAGESALRPCGMVARDILRLEAGLPMWGHELNETVDPVTAGLMKFVDADRQFSGADAIRCIAASGPSRRRVALESESPAMEGSIPRLGTVITDTSGREIGTVTSAAISRSGNVVAQAYLSTEMAVESQDLIVGSGENAVKSRATRVFE
jgi:aminomethyltransferase